MGDAVVLERLERYVQLAALGGEGLRLAVAESFQLDLPMNDGNADQGGVGQDLSGKILS